MRPRRHSPFPVADDPRHAIPETGPRSHLVAHLRERIRRIEGRTPALAVTPAAPREDDGCSLPPSAPPQPSSSPFAPHDPSGPAWTLGVPVLDRLLGPVGLDTAAVHELKPVHPSCADDRMRASIGSASTADWAAAWGAARTFVLALAARRLAAMERAGAAAGPLLWCQLANVTHDLGGIYAPGLEMFGIAPERLILVEAERAQDALWAIEEALKSRAPALVVGLLEEVDLTPARRLALAAHAHATPCLILTHPATPAMAAAASRWRIAPAASALHPLVAGRSDAARADPYLERLPGPLCLLLTLERLRSRPMAADALEARVAWCDEAFRFRLATPVRDRADGAGEAWSHPA